MSWTWADVIQKSSSAIFFDAKLCQEDQRGEGLSEYSIL